MKTNGTLNNFKLDTGVQDSSVPDWVILALREKLYLVEDKWMKQSSGSDDLIPSKGIWKIKYIEMNILEKTHFEIVLGKEKAYYCIKNTSSNWSYQEVAFQQARVDSLLWLQVCLNKDTFNFSVDISIIMSNNAPEFNDMSWWIDYQFEWSLERSKQYLINKQ